MATQQRIEKALQQALQPAYVEVIDDSALHAGHEQAGGGHFTVIVASEQFVGKTPVERHRLVYDVLQAELEEHIHALRIKTLTPEQWNART